MESYCYTKQNVKLKEYRIYSYLNNLELPFIPKLYSYNKETQTLETQKINGLNLSDMYGENFKDVPNKIIKTVRNIIKQLYDIGIIYPDITGYNFIQDQQLKIWIVDFEHCFYLNNTIEDTNEEQQGHLQFVNKFCSNKVNSWNPDFA
jgi:tRNA A-37 threonylcarbamoyl transferase component Bud32